MTRRIDFAAGFAYIEVMVAVLLLALCALPAANAIKHGLNASNIAPARAQALRCMRDKMESVLAEPYDNLLAAQIVAAQNGNQKTAYSDVAANGCVERQVYIGVYQQNGTDDTAKSTPLLRVDVVSPDTNYAFTTLVSP